MPAGVNLGVSRTDAEVLVLMNPDVLVLPGCLLALLAALDAGAAVAGPQFFWDRGRRLLLPPTEVRSRRAELAAVLARQRPGWAARARRAWRRHARRHWEARAPLPSHALSGSLLALRRATWQRVGPFDAGYRLFFEETDWLLRARRLGLPALYVPAAEAVHLFNQSAAREPQAQAWFEESAHRFRRRHYGAWFEGLLRRVDGWGAGSRPADIPALPADGLRLDRLAYPFPLWAEVSAGAAGYPAAAELLAEPAGVWRLPDEVRDGWGGGPLTLRLSDGAGRERACFRLAGREAV